MRDAAGEPLDRFAAEFELYRQFLDFGTEVPPHDVPDLPPDALTPVQLWQQMQTWQVRILGAWRARQISADATRRLMTDVGNVLKARIERSEKGAPIGFSEGGFATATDPLSPGFRRVLKAVEGTRLDTPAAKVDLIRRVTDLARATDCAAISDPRACEATITGFADDAIETFMKFHGLDPVLLDKAGVPPITTADRGRRSQREDELQSNPGQLAQALASPLEITNQPQLREDDIRHEARAASGLRSAEVSETPEENGAGFDASASPTRPGPGGRSFEPIARGFLDARSPADVSNTLGAPLPGGGKDRLLQGDGRVIRLESGRTILVNDNTAAEASGVPQDTLRDTGLTVSLGEFQTLDLDDAEPHLFYTQLVRTDQGLVSVPPKSQRDFRRKGEPSPIDPAELGIDLGPYPIPANHPIFIDPSYIVDRRGITRTGAGVEVINDATMIRITPANADIPIVEIPMRDLNVENISRLHPDAHQYHVVSKAEGNYTPDQFVVFGTALIDSPTLNRDDDPATIEGTPNDANPTNADLRVEFAELFTGENPVRSYVFPSNDPNRSDVVINFTMPGHALYPGYVIRFAERDDRGRVTLHTYGEGIAFEQSPNFLARTPFVPDTYLLSDWKQSHGRIIAEVGNRLRTGE